MTEPTSETRRWWVLAAATLALGMMTIDVSIVRVALPTIQAGARRLRRLPAVDRQRLPADDGHLRDRRRARRGPARPAARLPRRGDRLHHRLDAPPGSRPRPAILIAARAMQGLGAAIMTPGNVAMVTDAFAGRSLGRPMGVLTGVGSIGVSIGGAARRPADHGRGLALDLLHQRARSRCSCW